MKQLLVTFEIMLPDEAVNDDADAIVDLMEKTLVATDVLDAVRVMHEGGPIRPVGKVSDWTFEGHE